MNGRQLADRLGISQGHASRLRSGDRLPSMTLMFEIDDAIGWPPAEQMAAIRKKQYHVELNKRLDADTPEPERQNA